MEGRKREKKVETMLTELNDAWTHWQMREKERERERERERDRKQKKLFSDSVVVVVIVMSWKDKKEIVNGFFFRFF